MDFLNNFDDLSGHATEATAAARRTLRQFLRDLFPNLRDAAIRWSEDDAGSMAASVAYYLALSLFPLVLLLVSGLGLFLKFTEFGQDAREQLLSVIAQQGSPAFEQNFRQVIEQLESQSVVSGPSGLVAAVLAAIGVFAQLDRGFDRVWRVRQLRGGSLQQTAVRVARHRFWAFLMLLSLGGMIAGLFAATMVFEQVMLVVDTQLPFPLPSLAAVEFAFTLAINSLLFATLYKFLPKLYVPWRYALRGGLLAAVVWEVGRHALGAVFIGMRYTSAYGVLGSFIAILLWCYYAMSIIFFGAEYVQVLQRRAEAKAEAEKAAQQEDTPEVLPIAEYRSAAPAAAAKQRPRRAA